jgi:hypothetical protein
MRNMITMVSRYIVVTTASTAVCEGQQATVLQLPAEPKTALRLRLGHVLRVRFGVN